MKEKFHITRKVLLGYSLLIAIALFSVIYILNVIQEFASEDTQDEIPRRKVYLVTNTQSLLYESEALSEFVNFGKMADSTDIDPETLLNETLDRAQQNLDSLRLLSEDSNQQIAIDTISKLIERKRLNTKELLSIWNNADFERLYNRNIEKVLASQDKLAKEVEMLKKVQVNEDTVIVRKKPKSFFKRLADVFSPSKGDSGVVRRSSREYIASKNGTIFNPADTISSILKRLQRNVAGQRKELYSLVIEYAGKLRYDNREISREVNQMLRDIEKKELNASIERMNYKQDLLRSTSGFIAAIALISALIVIVFVIFIAKDVSRSQFYRRQLEKAKQYAEDLLHMREKLMLTISHDIRAPLSSIIGYTELLQRLHPDGRQRYYLDNMNASSSHILSLVNDLLDFHRLESNQMILNLLPFNVSSLLNEIYLSFKPLADNKGLVFIIKEQQDKNDIFYLGDPIRIRQIISNLLSNAIKFTSEGTITFEYAIKEDEKGIVLHIVVSDQGCGIPEADKEKIFNEFSRVSGSEKAEGFGLGLAISRKLITIMNGLLTLESEVGKGSTFVVNLPLATSSTQTDKKEIVFDVSEERASGKSLRCLLVDDDLIQLSLAEELLKYLGVEVQVCTNSLEIEALISTSSFDLVITDIQMPGLDGYVLLKKIRAMDIHNSKTIPIIALSGSVTTNEIELIKEGFTGFLNKPYTLKQLHAKLKSIFPEQFSRRSNLNFEALTAFAGNDFQASAAILKTFCNETANNLVLLKQALEKNDRKESARLGHKFLPLFSMIGASDLVPLLETLEKKSDTLSDVEWLSVIKKVIAQISQIVSAVKLKIGD